MTANPHASEAGIGILRAGGSAVDAAIAIQLVLSLVEPQSSGIGGGAFMLVFDAPDEGGGRAEIVAYEGRETAPAAATPDMFLDANGNPGGLRERGVRRVGRRCAGRDADARARPSGARPAALGRAVRASDSARDQGFAISPRLHFLLDGFKRFARAEEFRAHFYDESGEPRPTGHRLINEEYAATLRTLAAQGSDAMYEGELAEAIVAAVRGNSVRPGRMTLDDLRGYVAHQSAPLCSPYREWRVCGPQLPSSGGVTVQQIWASCRRSTSARPATIRSHRSTSSPKPAGSRSQIAIYISGTRASSAAPVEGPVEPELLAATARD